jgi:hypothetical protein
MTEIRNANKLLSENLYTTKYYEGEPIEDKMEERM